ncbi:hypothetical protein FRC07_004380 [Ceratobasidium sp. 392]|nr:hypothetical protein FRC07_004380 [Ceratobasidium sp. 392]
MTRHSRDGSLFYTPEQLAFYVVAGSSTLTLENIGKPEHITLALPSRLKNFGKSGQQDGDMKLANLEATLRRAACFQALARVRTTSQQKALLLKSKQKHVRGEVHNTRVQGMIRRLSARVDLAVWEYTNSRSALFSLGASEEDQALFQQLAPNHLSGLTSLLQGDRSTGEGERGLPWFWSVRSSGTGNAEEAKKEEDEAMRVEWFRGKPRYERWEEEDKIIRREMASVLFSYSYEGELWDRRAAGTYASFLPGYQAFCTQQASMWQKLKDDALRQFREALPESARHNETCKRAAERFL